MSSKNENAGDDGHVEDQTEDGDRVVRSALPRLRVPRQWWKHAKQDRGQRDSEPDRDGDRRPLRALIGHRPQRPEQGHAQHQREAEPQARVGKTLAVPPTRVSRLEEPDLSQERARDRKLNRDHRLEILNRHVHDDTSI
jgi:hypothetical protein